MRTIGYAAHNPTAALVPFRFDHRSLRCDDVAIEILYCGICHSDLHSARNDWSKSRYPLVPGHEIVGKVIDVGPDVTGFHLGQIVAVGCMVDSCGHCDQCRSNQENYCRNGWTGTYNGIDRQSGEPTRGGYSKHIVVRAAFVLHVPDGLEPSRVGPLLCAGITVYSPMRRWGVGPGSRIGVAGLGGLGHLAVKFAAALGADVTVISRSAAKERHAINLGATRLLVTSDVPAMAEAANSFDLILDTVPVRHNLNPYLPLLEVDGTLVLLGQIGPVDEMGTAPLIFGRRNLAGSLIGGIAETREMLEFCGRTGIQPDVELIDMQQINEAFQRLEEADLHHRLVIDMASLQIT